MMLKCPKCKIVATPFAVDAATSAYWNKLLTTYTDSLVKGKGVNRCPYCGVYLRYTEWIEVEDDVV